MRGWSEAVSASVRLAGSAWGGIDGFDPALDPTIAPTQDPRVQGGRRVDMLLGVGWRPPDGPLQRHRLALEIGVPIWQDLEGPQLAGERSAAVAWQIRF